MKQYLNEKTPYRWLISGLLILMILAAVFATGQGSIDADGERSAAETIVTQKSSLTTQGTNVMFAFKTGVTYEVELYDILARRLDGIIFQGKPENQAAFKWEALSNLPEGVYYITIKPEGKKRQVRKFVRLNEEKRESINRPKE